MKALTLFAVFLCVCYALEGPSDYLRDSDKSELKKLLTSPKSFSGLKNTFFTVSTLQRLKESVPDKSKVCESSNDKVNELNDIYYSVSIQDALGCVVAPSEKVQQDIKKALGSEHFLNLYYGISSALVLRKNKQLTGLDAEIKSAVAKLIKLGEEDGTFKSTPRSDDGSVLNGGLALLVLSQYASDSTLFSAQDKSQLESVLSNAQDIFTSFGEETEDSLHLVDSGSKASNLRVTSSVFKGFTALASALNDKSIKPDDDKFVSVAEYFIQHKRVVSVEDAYYVVEGLTASSYNTLAVPVVLSLSDSSVSSSAKDGSVSVKLTNVLGDNVDAKVSLVKAYPQGSPSKSLLSNQELKDNKFNLLSSKPEAGSYVLEFKVSSPKSPLLAISNVQRTLKVVSSVSLTDVQLTVSASSDINDKDSKKYKVDSAKGVSDLVSLEEFQHLFVTFQVKGNTDKNVAVQQAFVRIYNEEKESISVAKYSNKQYLLHVSGEELSELLDSQSNTYNAQLIVADSFVQNPQLWKLASVKAKFGNHSSTQVSSDPYAPKPEIVHAFRAAEKRPNAPVSFAFTLAVLAPFLIFAVGLLRIGINFGRYPTSGLYPIYALGFHATLGVILALYAIYWINLTMVTTLKYLGVLAVPYFFFASKTLNHLAESSSGKTHRD